MSPRPIHRWKTFWLGILVITFLARAWHDSTRWQTKIHFGKYTIHQAGSGISLADWKVTPTTTAPWGRYPITEGDPIWARPHIDSPELFRSTGDPKQLYLYYNINADWSIYEARNSAARHFKDLLSNEVPGPRTGGFSTRSIVPNSRAIFLPHWLLILTFTTLWTTYLLWRHRRMKRHLRQGPLSERSGE